VKGALSVLNVLSSCLCKPGAASTTLTEYSFLKNECSRRLLSRYKAMHQGSEGETRKKSGQISYPDRSLVQDHDSDGCNLSKEEGSKLSSQESFLDS